MGVTEGTVVDGRYRILNRIGSGGMADVYLAEDAHLGRQVAIKMLYRRFAQDQEFVERFRREASAAAGLQHPNVVNVFDRGEHASGEPGTGGTYYIAMEYLQGRTLKDVLLQDAPLDQTRAIDIATQVLAAASFAHRRGVIHRDFKPHNAMLDSNDQVKVTDFGIARAGASEMTETGSVMGTAQYLSPEQAQGHSVTAASDLYSIGVMLYEMVAGQLPFTGDSAVSVALHHLNDPPPPISGVRPDVNPVLEAVIMRALVKDPAGRYADADEFSAALSEARTAVAEGRSTGQSTAAFAPVPAPAAGEEEPDREEGSHWGRWVLLVLVLLGALAGAYFLFLAPAGKVTVPDVSGKPEAAARAEITNAKLEVGEVKRQADLVVPAGSVVSQDPRAGDRAEEESKVGLVVSTGPGKRTVPAVAGESEQDAVKELIKAGFKVQSTERASSSVKKGDVIGTTPPSGTDADVGSRIVLKVSSGPKKVTVPDVVGITEDSATSQLDDEGLLVARETQSSPQPEGTVLAQDPASGSVVDEGSRITLTVSKGEEQVAVPDVVDLTEADARGQLRQAGFNVLVKQRAVDSADQDGTVVDQRPSSGRQLRKGATVTIFVGTFKEPPVPGEPQTP